MINTNINVGIFQNKNNLFSTLVSILQDQSMTTEFVLGQFQECVPPYHKSQSNTPIDQEKSQSEYTYLEDPKSNISRLEIQIKKNQIDFTPIAGQIFLLLFKAYLFSKHSKQNGLLMMTNYRICFFKGALKRVDLPFGLIQSVQMKENNLQITFQLKFPHFWKFQIVSPKSKISLLKNFGLLYYKPKQLKNIFCFEHFLKSNSAQLSYQFRIQQQYKRLKFNLYPQMYTQFHNQSFNYIQTYTNKIYIPTNSSDINQVLRHRRNYRLPILAYIYHSSPNSYPASMWIASSYQDIKNINKNLQSEYLKAISNHKEVEVYVAQSKNVKILDQSSYSKNFNVKYLNLYSNQQLRKSQIKLFQVFLHEKKPLINQILNSLWYQYITKSLQSCIMIRNSILQNKSVMIRCSNGWDKSLLLSSIVQIILQPYYRTFQGFQCLIMKMFIHFGYPFSVRLGEQNQGKQICPLFLLFLDCVTQLINQNANAFEYNFKYVSLLANLMHVNIYGTFVCKSPKQYIQGRIQMQTFSIWPFLKSPLSRNCSYTKNSGVLNVTANINNCRFWKQYFCMIVSKKKQSYSFQDIAEQNQDYLNLNCLRIKNQNQAIKLKVKHQQKLIEELNSKLNIINSG